MEDLNWLADLANDCCAFAKKHSLPHVTQSALEILREIERDYGVKIMVLPRSLSRIVAVAAAVDDRSSNVVMFPVRPFIPVEFVDLART